jgi:hypothetical protein
MPKTLPLLVHAFQEVVAEVVVFTGGYNDLLSFELPRGGLVNVELLLKPEELVVEA